MLKNPYIAPIVKVVVVVCEQGYAYSAELQSASPEKGNSATTYDHTTWEW